MSSLITRSPRTGVLLYVLQNRVWEALLMYEYTYLQPPTSPFYRGQGDGECYIHATCHRNFRNDRRLIGSLTVLIAKQTKTLFYTTENKTHTRLFGVRVFIITPQCIFETYTRMGIVSESCQPMFSPYGTIGKRNKISSATST